jgi:predicted nucleotidyltransferase
MDSLILTGGCAVGLLITDRARPPIRPTVDVDLVTEVASLSNYYQLCDQIRKLGFAGGDLLCRFTKGDLIVDVMPSDPDIINFSNSWFSAAAKHAVPLKLTSGHQTRLITAPYFLATKLESFNGRGERDYGHRDIEDIINVVDGRPEVVTEVQESEDDVREFLRMEFDDLLSDPGFVDHIPWHLHPDQASQARLSIIVGRLRSLAGL